VITLPNGNSIDLDMLEIALDDSDPAKGYFLNLVTGEVVFLSDDLSVKSRYVVPPKSHKVVPVKTYVYSSWRQVSCVKGRAS
jgi:hypothetical protein